MIVSLVILFIITNYFFIDSTFFRHKTGFSIKNIQLIYTLLLTVVFLRTKIDPLGLVTYFSLLIIYIFRISKIVALKMPKPAAVEQTHEINYYLALYFTHFLKPVLLMFIYLAPALLLILLLASYNSAL